MASRVVWKGAVSFGLVHVPVVLRAAARANDLDFDWLDRRDMAPVGYNRINKRTGKPIDKEFIVKGYQYQKGEYVLMSDEDFRRANVAATQTVEILSFVDAASIPPYFFETPYYLEPDRRGQKGYALLREVLRDSGRAALASVVIHTKQHLAAVLVYDEVLVLNTMRFADEVLAYDDLALPGRDLGEVGIGKRELDMAQRLVDEMTEDWKPQQYVDSYREDLLARIDEKIESGETHLLTPAAEGEAAPASAEIIDLTAMLKRSIEERGGSKGVAKTAAPTRGKTAATSAKSAGTDRATSNEKVTAAKKAPAHKKSATQTPASRARKTTTAESASRRTANTTPPRRKQA